MGEEPKELVAQCHQCHQDDQHRDHVQIQRDAVGGAPRNGVHGTGCGLGRDIFPRSDFPGLRNHQQRDHDGGRRADDRCDQNVPHHAGNLRAENGCVEDHDGAGDVGHAAAHRDEQFAAREPIEIGPDQQRRFQHAQKNIGRRAESDGAADAHGFL